MNITKMADTLPVGAVVTKLCGCGDLCGASKHPQYVVESFMPYPGLPEFGTYILRRLDTGRRHRTRSVHDYAVVEPPKE